jgi:hypothetical protein
MAYPRLNRGQVQPKQVTITPARVAGARLDPLGRRLLSSSNILTFGLPLTGPT